MKSRSHYYTICQPPHLHTNRQPRWKITRDGCVSCFILWLSLNYTVRRVKGYSLTERNKGKQASHFPLISKLNVRK